MKYVTYRWGPMHGKVDLLTSPSPLRPHKQPTMEECGYLKWDYLEYAGTGEIEDGHEVYQFVAAHRVAIVQL